jgi:hypothetical protein
MLRAPPAAVILSLRKTMAADPRMSTSGPVLTADRMAVHLHRCLHHMHDMHDGAYLVAGTITILPIQPCRMIRYDA